jgi:hypothetical protein
MSPGEEYLLEQARAQAQRHLAAGARYMEISSNTPLWTRRMGSGNGALLLRFELPGVLTVYDPKTLCKLAVSELGKPHVLQQGFIPENVLTHAHERGAGRQ